MYTNQKRPRPGDLYSLGDEHDVLVENANSQHVYYYSLGWGKRYYRPLVDFLEVGTFVERRIERLRRACAKHKLTETDEWVESQVGKPVGTERFKTNYL